MKTYRYEEQSFEIDIPEDRSVYEQSDVVVAFTCGPNENLNINIEPMSPEPSPDDAELYFTRIVRAMGNTKLEFGRITIEAREHTWVRYQISGKVPSKKYTIVLGGIGYGITASCNDQRMLSQREKVWDAIAESLRLLEPIDNSI